MKALLKIVDTQANEAFHIMRVKEPSFFHSWHFHPEYEIMLVLAGTGIRFVGDSMERFQPGDLVLLGRDIPHFYCSDEQYREKESTHLSQAIVIYFRDDFLGEKFCDMPDMGHIKRLFSNAKRGIRFSGCVREELIERVAQVDGAKNGLARLIDLLSILEIMGSTKEFDLLSSQGFTHNADEDECKRMNNVYQYIINNYIENPTLDKVAEVANMSSTAFCRYFKSRSNKTYTQFLNEIKIGNACKLLIDSDRSISEICFQIGFNNFAHFNSQFKRIVGVTPTRYRREHFSFL